MKHIHRASLGLILVLVLGAFSLPALAESSTHALTWVSGKNSTVSADKLTMEAKPTANYETEHIMEMNFSFTGLADKYKAEIRIPAHIFYDRSGSAVGTYMVPLPQYNPSDPESSEPPNAATKFNWRLDSETDEIVISNYAPVEDNFFLTLQVKYFVTPHLVKEGYTKDFSSTMQVQTRSGEVETYTSNDLTMIYRTKADLSSLTKNTSDAVTYKDWQSSWGPVPDGINAADYFFVRWRLYGNASTNDTQPFSISFKETNPPSAEYGTMFAYSSAFSGGVKKATLEEFNQLNNPFTTVDKPRTSSTTNATTFDIYTYFMYPRSPLDADLKATVKNQAEIELFGVDGAYDIRKASGVKEFLGKPPAPTSPGNKVSAIYKNNSGTTYGGINKLESNQQNGLPVRLTSTNTPGRGNFYFSGEVTGWDMTKEGDAYGVRPFTADLTDHELSIYNPITKKQQRLVEGEYQFTKLYFTGFTVYDPVVTETSMSTVGRANALYKPLLLQVEQGGQWKDYANIQKQTNGSYVFTPVTDGPAVPPGLNLNIPLPAGTTGVRYLYTDNAVLVRFSSYSYLETEIFPTPGILEIIDGQENASVTNTMSLRGLDDQNVERAPRRTTSATHYPYRTTSKNYFSKSFAPAVNNVNTSRFYFPITLTAYSMVTSPDLTLEEVKAGNHVIEQKVSTFYDLLPPGTYADLGSIRVTGYGDAMKNTVFPHTVEVHDNWKSSGRALLVVHAQAPEGVSNFHHFVSGTYSSLYSGMSMTFNMYNTWVNVVDNGEYLPNYAAYESQDGPLPFGYPDNAGDSKIPSSLKAAFTDLNRDGNPPGTPNSFMYSSATPVYAPLKAAEVGFRKAVASPEDPAFDSHTEVQAGGEYTYRLRLENPMVSTKNLVFYDILENAFGDNAHWQGGLLDVDVSHARSLGVNVKVYYSLEDPTDAGLFGDANHLDQNPAFWKSWTADPPSDTSRVRALAFDLRKKTNGQDFIAGPNRSVLVNIQMRAPVNAEEHIEAGNLAYNRSFCSNIKSDQTGGNWDPVLAIEASNTVTVALRDMGLTLDKTSNPPTGTETEPAAVYGGDTLTYRLSLANANLAQSLENILLEDVIPDGLQADLASIQVMLDDNSNTLQPLSQSTRALLTGSAGQRLSFRIISLAGKEKITLLIPVTVLPMHAGKPVEFRNTATVTQVFGQDYGLTSPPTHHKQKYAQLNLTAEKILTGRDMAEDEFFFLLKDEQDRVLQRKGHEAAAVGVGAGIVLDPLYFDKPGTYRLAWQSGQRAVRPCCLSHHRHGDPG